MHVAPSGFFPPSPPLRMGARQTKGKSKITSNRNRNRNRNCNCK
jgi:hypothetical protein